MKYLITYKLFEGLSWVVVENREMRDVSLFTNDEVIDIENMFLEYVDKYQMGNLKLEHDEDDDADYAYYDKDGAEFQYEVSKYRNVAIDIYYTGDSRLKSKEIFKDIKDNFIPRLKAFGYYVIHFGESYGNWHSNGEIEDDKWEITLTITKRD